MNAKRFSFLWVLALGFGTTVPSAATQSEMVLGANGAIYSVRSAAYGELFPSDGSSLSSNPALALEVTRPGSGTERILVPKTDGSETERFPSLLYEEDSNTVYLVWESRVNSIHPVLNLVGFDGERWSEPIEIIGNPFSPKSSPQIAVTRDSFEQAQPDGTTAKQHRTVLHLVWAEATGDTLQTFYSPILFNNGIYLQQQKVFSLNDLASKGFPDVLTSTDPTASLMNAPTIQAGEDGRSVVIAFALPEVGRVVSLEVDVLPEEVRAVADKARSHIIDIGRRFYPSKIQSLADGARSHIIDIGKAFHPEIVRSIAEQVHAYILSGSAPDLQSIGDGARSHIIDIGYKLSDRGLKGPGNRIALGFANVALEGGVPSLIEFRVGGNWPIPEIGAGEVRLFVSQTGSDVIVSWARQDRILYRVSGELEWSEVRVIPLTESFSAGQAYLALDRRVRSR